MKKLVVLVCTLCMLFGVLAVNASAVDGFVIAIAPQTVDSGSYLEVPVTIAGAPQKMAAIALKITFDTDIFEWQETYSDEENDVGFIEGKISPEVNAEDGVFYSTVTSGNGFNVTTAGTLFTVRFKVKEAAMAADGTTTLAISAYDDGIIGVDDTEYNNEGDVTYTNGIITINHICVKDVSTAAHHEATCGVNEYTAYNCINSSCTAIIKEEVDGTALEHNYSTTPDPTKSTPRTCTVDGENVYVCSNGCGIDKTVTKEEDPTLAAPGHSWGDATANEENGPTCTDPGYGTATCTVCNAVSNEVEMPATGHTVQHYDKQSPKMVDGVLQDGHYEFWYCTVCSSFLNMDPTNTSYVEETNNVGTGAITEIPSVLVLHRLLGDANNDEGVSSKDALWIARYVVKKYTEDNLNMINADVNGDGIVSSKDALAIARHVVKKTAYLDLEAWQAAELAKNS